MGLNLSYLQDLRNYRFLQMNQFEIVNVEI